MSIKLFLLFSLATQIAGDYDVINPNWIASNCSDALQGSYRSGTYQIYIPEFVVGPVYCMADPAGGEPWLVIQRRVDGQTNFNRQWCEYEHGFGDLNRNFFIGLYALHKLTNQHEPQELWLELTDFYGDTRHAFYDVFAIGDASDNYRLYALGAHSGDAPDALQYHEGMQFSTFDSDNDRSSLNCADVHKGGWWYFDCYQSNLNGVYGSEGLDGISWYNYDRNNNKQRVTLQYVQMAIRARRERHHTSTYGPPYSPTSPTPARK